MLVSIDQTKDEFSFFASINSTDKIPLLKSGKYLLRCRRTNLYKQGDKLTQLFYLIFGRVLLQKTDAEGKIISLPQINNGSFFGLNSLFNLGEANHSATIQNDSLLLVIPTTEFEDLLNRWPNLKSQIINQLIHQLDLTEMKIHL